MNFIRFFIIILGVLGSGVSYSQCDNIHNAMKEIPGAVVLRYRAFNPETLWSYTNGNIGIYKEYGFKHATVNEFMYKSYRFKVELFELADVESAFGLFSFLCNSSSKADSLPFPNRLSKFQVQAAFDRYYCNIVLAFGTPEELHYALSFLNSIYAMSNRKIWEVPILFKSAVFSPYLDGVVFIKGVQGVSAYVPRWERQYSNLGEFKLVVLPIQLNCGYVIFSELSFNSTIQVNKYCKTINIKLPTGDNFSQVVSSDGVLYRAWSYSSRKLVVMETPRPEKDVIDFSNDIQLFVEKYNKK